MPDLPAIAPDTPYYQERQRVRCQTAVLKGWAAWQLKEYRGALAAFHTALDLDSPDPELVGWTLRHLVERRKDYLQAPINGAWPERSLCRDPIAPGSLAEHCLPNRSHEAQYNETAASALRLLHRLLLAQSHEFSRHSHRYFAYHPVVEPVTQMVLAPVTKGTFLMGSPEDEPERYEDETQHQVTLSRDFWMGIYPVTREQYLTGTSGGPVKAADPDRPIVEVSWEDAVAFCKRLTEQATDLPAGYEYRLPTEAEWEYCCRAGTTTATCFGDSLSSEQANFNGERPYGGASKGPNLKRTSDVGAYLANPWGLCDMHGNVWEWCLDAAEGGIKTDTYVDGVIDPLCKEGGRRVYRGGGWVNGGGRCRSAYRIAYEPGIRRERLGFRMCLAPSPDGSET
jgi:formylglycine-generating enzyme required for sulfatase activity